MARFTSFLGWGLLAALGLTLVAAQRDAIVLGLFFFILPGLLLLAAPNVLLYATLPYVVALFARAMGSIVSPALAAAVALGAVVAVGLVVPTRINRPVEGEVAALRSADRELAAPLADARSIGLMLPAGRPFECGSLCQRLLYGGGVPRVLVAAAPRQWAEPAAGAKAKAYRVERRASCPATDVPNAGYTVQRAAGRGTISTSVDVAAVTRMRIAAGECLVTEDASLGAADIVIVENQVKHGQSPYEAAWSRPAESVEARRLAVYRNEGAGFAPIFQRTHVKWRPLATPFHFGLATAGLNGRLAFGRVAREEGAYALDDVLARDLKLDADAPTGVNPDREREMVAAAVRDPAAGAGLALVPNYLLRLSRQGPIDDADFETIRLIVDDERLRAELRNIPTYRFGPEAAVLAQPLARRLLSGDPGRDHAYLGGVAHVVGRMPPGTMAAAKAELEAVARDPARRGVAAGAWARLADSGADSAPLLIELFAGSIGELPRDSRERMAIMETAIGAAQGLCLLGPAAAGVRPYAQQLVRQAVADKATGSNRARAAMLLLAHIGFASDVDEAFRESGGVPGNITHQINRSLHEPIDQACRFGMV